MDRRWLWARSSLVLLVLLPVPGRAARFDCAAGTCAAGGDRSALDAPRLPLGPLDVLPLNDRTRVQTRAGSVSARWGAFLLREVRGRLGDPTGIPLTLPQIAALPELSLVDAVRARGLEAEGLRRQRSGAPPVEFEPFLVAAQALRAGTRNALLARLPALRVDPLPVGANPGDDLTLSPRDIVSEWALGIVRELQDALIGETAAGPIVLDPASNLFERGSAIAGFLGPDGIFDTADDLPVEPFVTLREDVRLLSRLGSVPGSGGFQTLVLAPQRAPDGSLVGADANVVGRAGDTVQIYLVRGSGFDPGTGRELADPNVDCVQTLRGSGVNAHGECILLASGERAGVNGDGTADDGLPLGRLTALAALSDPAHRPPSAVLEPADRTDLLSRAFGAARLPARPRSRAGRIRFPVPAIASFSRRVDAVTGAPVRATGPLECRVRRDDAGTALGPDGQASADPNDLFNLDNDFPSAGNCLLWADPPAPGAPQPARSALQVAGAHSADQTEFHRRCSVAFDPDTASCWLDALNSATHGARESEALAGHPISLSVVESGFDLIRKLPGSGLQVELEPFDALDFPGLDPNAARALYLESLASQLNARFAVTSQDVVADTESVVRAVVPPLPRSDPRTGIPLSHLFFNGAFPNLSIPQQALLGCGAAFGSACDTAGLIPLLFDPHLARQFGLELHRAIADGVDLMNSDASVWTQEAVRVKALSPGVPVGLRDAETGARQAGISTPANPTQTLSGGLATDDVVEPFPWLLDPNRPAGRVRFVDPRGAPGAVAGGENCTPLFGGPDPGCTVLEVISSNAERLAMLGDILGADQGFDPPETAAEVLAMTDEDPSNDATGDPLAGPDGIVFANWIEQPRRGSAGQPLGLYDYRSDGRFDAIRVDLSNYQRAVFAFDVAHLRVASDFESCAALLAATGPGACYKALSDPIPDPASSRTGQVIGALPLAVTAGEVLPGGGLASIALALQELHPLELQALASAIEHARGRGETLDLQVPFIETDPADPDFGRLARDDATGVAERRPATILIKDNRGQLAIAINLLRAEVDQDFVPDLDANGDGQLDFLDDGTPGPVADDAITCGTGIPGDPLFDALQVEMSGVERSLLTAAVGPLPSRAPSGCPSVVRQEQVVVADALGQRHWIWHTGPATPDADADGVADTRDDCPFTSDPDQLDRGGLGHGSGPDGLGDACQCGDVTGDGYVDLSDLVVMRRAIAGLEPNPAFRAPELCNVRGPIDAHDGPDSDALRDDCGVADAVVLQRALGGLPPGIDPATCSSAPRS
ncbi:MAG: hypothetical protein ACE5IL_16265 [Myxococcota bacterium]